MIRITFGNLSVDWSMKTVCLSGSCNVGASEGILSADGSKIHIFYIYDNADYLYFVTLKFTDGTVLSSRYKSTLLCSYVYGSALSGDYLAANAKCSIPYLVLFSTKTSLFTVKSFSFNNLFGLSAEIASGRFIDVGAAGSNGYQTKLFPDLIDAHPDFTSAVTFIMSSLSAGTEDIDLETGITSTSSTETVGGSTPGSQTVVYNSGTSYTSDFKGQTSDQTYTVTEKNVIVDTPDLTCSSSGTTSITYSIGDCVGSTAPTWAIINSVTAQLHLSPPNVSTDTDFCFIINSAISGVTSPIQKTIKVTIKNCIASNCNTCSDTSNSVCTQCDTGYSLTIGICVVDTAFLIPFESSKDKII